MARRYLPLTVLAVLVALLPLRSAAAADGLSMTAGLELSTIYLPDSWQPVHVELRNTSSDDIDGNVVLPLADPQAPAIMTKPVRVPAYGRARTTLWAYFPRETPGAGTGQIAPLGIAEWRGPDGAALARAEIAGVPLWAADERATATGGIVLAVGERNLVDDDPYDLTALLRHLTEATGIPLDVASAAMDRFPRHGAGLRWVRAVILEGVDPESFDLAQRAALREYLQTGGCVVLAAPPAGIGSAGTWFEPYFPVRLLGTRRWDRIAYGTDKPPLKLRGLMSIIEAVAGSGDVLLRDKDYVHAAVQRVGMGRVVFTSFPLNGLDEKQPQVAVLWEQLLGARRPLSNWNETQLGQARHHVLASMIGRKVAPWSIAAAVVVGYVLLAVAAQAMFLGPARPKAFVASIAVALVVSGALLAMGMARRGDTGLQSARLAVIDVGADGNGWQQESLAFVGTDDAKMALRPRDERVMIRPALADDGNPPTVKQQPFVVDNTGVHAERIERVWEASGPADPKLRIDAAAQLGADGLTLDVQNDLGASLEAPLVVWNGRVLATAFLPTGRSTVRQFQLNARQVFTELGFVTSDEAKRRAQIVAASLAAANPSSGSAAEAPPMLIGWIAMRPESALVSPVDREGIESKSMVMVRTPLRFNVLPPKSVLSIPASLVHVDTGRLPYDRATGESVPTPQPGEWTLTFRPPPQAGRVRPSRATLSARVTLPVHSMELRKGSARNAPVLAEWSRDVGAKDVSFDCAPGDYDEDGTIRIKLQVNSHEAGGTVPWQVSDLGMSFDAAEVIGPPKPIVLDPPPRPDQVRRGEPENEPYVEEKQ